MKKQQKARITKSLKLTLYYIAIGYAVFSVFTSNLALSLMSILGSAILFYLLNE
jgi:hypothetical protein